MMDVRIYPGVYKDIEAIVMESEALIVTIIPASGGKIQSIYDKRHSKELLYQSTAPTFKLPTYDTLFGEGDVSGFDDMFPTIEACYYPLFPWQGTAVPDHGEVWALPWTYEIEDQSVKLTVHGVRFPYTLVKVIAFTQSTCLSISYMVHNRAPSDMAFLWAPHMLLYREPDTQIVLPPEVQHVFSTCTLDNRLGTFGAIHSWPETIADDMQYNISTGMPAYANKCEKYYALGKLEHGWCALHNPVTGYTIGLSYPIEHVPYLGVWDGTIGDHHVTALEPCTGDLDRLDTAIQCKRVSFIRSNSTCQWYLNVTIDTAEHIRCIDADGNIQL